MKVIKFKKWIETYLVEESIKDAELNKILDKISSKKELDDTETSFLKKYNDTTDDDYKDYSYLSKQDVCQKLSDLLDNNKKVICDLCDRDGKIGYPILSIDNRSEDRSYLTLSNRLKVPLKDNLLYNLLYNFHKDEYSLEEQDEYFEKLPISNEN